MAKASGLGQTTLSVDDASGTAKAIKNDITNWQMSTPRGVQDITGVDKSANERLLLLADGSVTLNGVFNAATGQAHDVFKTVPSTSVQRTVTQTVAVAPAVGDTINATVWVAPGSGSAVTGTLRLSAVGGTQESAAIAFTSSGGWTRVDVPLEVRRSGHSALRVEVVLGPGTFRLDSASLVRTRAGAPVAAPPAPPSRR